jgi:hypothetical protein
MRAGAEHTISAFWNTASSIIELFTRAACENYFRAAGCDQTAGWVSEQAVRKAKHLFARPTLRTYSEAVIDDLNAGR